MYSFSEAGGYSFTTTVTSKTSQHSSQTFQETTTTTQWEYTSNGYSHVQASDILFKDDEPHNISTQAQPKDSECQPCQTWYVPSKPVEKPSRSQEYLAPHKRYEGYNQTHNYKGRSNIRGHTISSSGESSRQAQSRSQSRQRQHSQAPRHQRSASRSSYNSNLAPAVTRERAQHQAPTTRVVNLTQTKRSSTNKRSSTASTRNPRAHSQRQRQRRDPKKPATFTKVNGKWIKNYVDPICYKFLNTGTCHFGACCKFKHVAKETNSRTRRNL